jgi:hypothetical protein
MFILTRGLDLLGPLLRQVVAFVVPASHVLEVWESGHQHRRTRKGHLWVMSLQCRSNLFPVKTIRRWWWWELAAVCIVLCVVCECAVPCAVLCYLCCVWLFVLCCSLSVFFLKPDDGFIFTAYLKGLLLAII